VAQADRLLVIGLVAGEDLEQRLVAVEGGVEVVQQFAALGLDIGAGQQRGARKRVTMVRARPCGRFVAAASRLGAAVGWVMHLSCVFAPAVVLDRHHRRIRARRPVA
jgi:hypothetical protein